MKALVFLAALPWAASVQAAQLSAPAATLSRVLQAVPPQFREPAVRFLDGRIDAAGLRAQLAARVGTPAHQPEAVSEEYLRTAVGDFARKAAGEGAQDRYDTAQAYAQLDAALAFFMEDGDRAPIADAAKQARASLTVARRRRLDEALARASSGLAEKAAEIPPVPGPVGRFMEPVALADVLDIELPFLRETLAEAKLAEDGAVAYDASGFPDEITYESAAKAHALLADSSLVARLDAEGRGLLERWAAVYRKTKDGLLTESNALARAVYAEPTPGGRDMSVLDYVRTDRFKTPKWWTWSSQHDFMHAPRGWAEITAERARSPFVKHLGKLARSTLYWAAVPGGELGLPDPEGMRVRVNWTFDGSVARERTLEVIAPVGREADGSPRWKGFFFKKIAGEWVPGNIKKAPPEDRCIKCHYKIGPDGEPRLTPVPAFLKTKQAFLDVGYEDTRLLEAYLKSL